MRAVAIAELGADPALMNLPAPRPGPGECLVRVIAAGLNPLDWKIADGALKDAVPYSFPLILGLDGAGVVDETGEDARFAPGEQVFGRFFGVPRGLGTYCEYTIAAPADAVVPIPDGLLYTEAAALPTAGMTALTAVEEAGIEAESGATVLVVGATGGVGQPTVALAAARGATVIATARPDMAERMGALGAAETVDHGSGEVAARVRDLAQDGLDTIIDLASDRPAVDRLAGLLKPGGVYVSTQWAVNPDALDSQNVRGVNIDYTPTCELLQRVADLVDEGTLDIPVEAEVPLEEAPAAVRRSRAGGARGKTVIRL